MSRRVTTLLVVASLLVAACSRLSPRSDEGSFVTVFGPYRGVEAERFAASLEPFERSTGIDVRYTGTTSLAADLAERAGEADLPDIAIIPQPAVVDDYVDRGLVVPVGEKTAANIEANYSADLVGLMTIDDTLYSVLYRANLKSLVWYLPDTFAGFGYSVPTTWDGLIQLTERMEDDGFAPWCLTMEAAEATGWVGTDWVEDLMLRLHEPDVYDGWVDGTVSFESEQVRAAFLAFAEIALVPRRVLGGRQRILGVPWEEAADPMFDTAPECLLHRQASFYESRLPDDEQFGTDYDVFVLPPMQADSEAPLLVGGELAAAFSDRPEVHALQAYLATPESGEAWAEAGGYTAPHSTFDDSIHDDPLELRLAQLIDEADVVRFDGSDMMTPAVGTGSFWKGMIHFVATGDLDTTLELIQAGYGDPEEP